MVLKRSELHAAVDEIIDHNKRLFVIDEERPTLLSREQVRTAGELLITAGFTPSDSAFAKHTFREIMSALGVKSWSFDDADASDTGKVESEVSNLTPMAKIYACLRRCGVIAKPYGRAARNIVARQLSAEERQAGMRWGDETFGPYQDVRGTGRRGRMRARKRQIG